MLPSPSPRNCCGSLLWTDEEVCGVHFMDEPLCHGCAAACRGDSQVLCERGHFAPSPFMDHKFCADFGTCCAQRFLILNPVYSCWADWDKSPWTLMLNSPKMKAVAHSSLLDIHFTSRTGYLAKCAGVWARMWFTPVRLGQAHREDMCSNPQK